MLTGHGNIETAVKAMKYGAYDFIQSHRLKSFTNFCP